MLSDNFWKILFILVLLWGIVFWWKSYQEKSAFRASASELAELIAFDEENQPRDMEEAQGRFIQAITLLHNAEQEGIAIDLLVNAANEYNELSKDGGLARMIFSGLFQSLKNANELGIFTDDSLWDLQDGQAVPITKGPFEGEKIAISHHVPPSIGTGAQYFIGNFVLVPESVAAASSDLELTENLYNTSIKLLSADIIAGDEAKAIKDNFYLQRERNRR